MLTIKCARCKTKLMKYKKIGKGKVLRCWESKINRLYESEVNNDKLICNNCENEIGKISSDKHQKERYVKMNSDEFTYTGTKIEK